MGGHTSDKKSASDNDGTGAGAPGVAFWPDAAHGALAPPPDLRADEKPDPSAMLPWVDDDHAATSDPRFWGDELRQEEFERRQRRDAMMKARRSKNAGELHDLPAAYRIAEHVVGSTHRFVVARPRVTSDLTALVTPTIGATNSSDHGFTALLPPSGFLVLGTTHENEIAIRYEPQKAGPVSAELVLEIRWTDGSVDVRTVTLHASARLRTEIPENEVPVSPNAQFQEAAELGPLSSESRTTPPPLSPETKAATALEFTQLASDVRQRANSLAERQREGVNVASEEARSFLRKPPEPSLVSDLIQLAISMGVAGVAGALAKHLGVRLAERLGRDKGSALVLGLADGLKEGMKKIGNGGTAKLPTAGKEEAGEPDAESTEPFSTNPRIAFFAAQRSMLLDLVDDNQALISAQTRRLIPLLERDPDQALAALRALDQAFEDAAGDAAKREQAQASSYQWVAAVTRASLGSTTATTHDRSYTRKVSNVENYSSATDGVLTIEIARSGDALTVTGAHVRGISQELADRLARKPLREAPIPIRLHVTSGGARGIVTLDEAKRMRVHGFLDHEDVLPVSEYVRGQTMPEQFEAQSTSRAEKIVATVLSKPLRQWGVSISSDDATDRSDTQ